MRKHGRKYYIQTCLPSFPPMSVNSFPKEGQQKQQRRHQQQQRQQQRTGWREFIYCTCRRHLCLWNLRTSVHTLAVPNIRHWALFLISYFFEDMAYILSSVKYNVINAKICNDAQVSSFPGGLFISFAFVYTVDFSICLRY